MTMPIQTIPAVNDELVVIRRRDFEALMEKAGVLPKLPPADKHGNRDALAFADAVIAREIVSRRIKVGWTQKELAKRSGVRMETISRVEGGRNCPTQETIERIDAAFRKAGV